MKKKQKATFPRSILKELAEDFGRLLHNSEGCLQVLDIIEEIPYDVRPLVIEGLASFYWPEMASFFYLLKIEYGKEMFELTDRALVKTRMLGMDTEWPVFFEGEFYKAYASCTRHTGRMSLDVAWKTNDKALHVESYFLSFRSDGIHSMLIAEGMPIKQFKQDRENLTDMEELTYEETCFLMKEAFNFNIRCMSRPALGRFLYKKYLDSDCVPDSEEIKALWRKLSIRLTPRQMVNSFFYALKYQDINYLLSLLSDNSPMENLMIYQLNSTLNPGSLLLEARVEDVRGSIDRNTVKAYAIRLSERQVIRDDYVFRILKEQGNQWMIAGIDRISSRFLDDHSEFNPFHMQVNCRIYEIVDMDELFDILDQVEHIREVEELPYGLHMRVCSSDEDYNYGLSFMTGVIADLVINGDEFVIMAKEPANMQEFHQIFTEGQQCLVNMGEYQVSVSAGFSYLTGQFVHFDDILLEEEEDLVFEDGLHCLTAHYVVKDCEMVLERLSQISSVKVELPGGYQVFYQLELAEGHQRFLAEFILGPNWVTISTFGEKDMGLIRNDFEKDMYEALEFDGLEVREEGIFEILTYDVKKQYPNLEADLKEMYLNKWYDSNLPTLRGMSPSEASETEEGKRLLWTLFKKIKQKEKNNYRGQTKKICLKEYIRKVNGGNHKK